MRGPDRHVHRLGAEANVDNVSVGRIKKGVSLRVTWHKRCAGRSAGHIRRRRINLAGLRLLLLRIRFGRSGEQPRTCLAWRWCPGYSSRILRRHGRICGATAHCCWVCGHTVCDGHGPPQGFSDLLEQPRGSKTNRLVSI